MWSQQQQLQLACLNSDFEKFAETEGQLVLRGVVSPHRR